MLSTVERVGAYAGVAGVTGVGVFLAFRGLDRFQVVADGFSVPGGRLLKERYVSPADEATKWVATRSARLRWRRASLSPALRERADSLFEAPDAGALHAVARMVAADRWHTALAKLSRDRNEARILSDADECFDEMWSSIAGARRRVWLEIYTLEDDKVGNGTLQRLTDAAARGVEVVVLYDHGGSPSVNRGMLRRLHDAGATVLAFNPVWPLTRKTGPFMYRNHKKVLLADDVAYCGSRNIADGYAGPRHGSASFRDMNVRLCGPVVSELEQLFAESAADGVANRAQLPAALLRVLDGDSEGEADGDGEGASADGSGARQAASGPAAPSRSRHVAGTLPPLPVAMPARVSHRAMELGRADAASRRLFATAAAHATGLSPSDVCRVPTLDGLCRTPATGRDAAVATAAAAASPYEQLALARMRVSLSQAPSLAAQPARPTRSVAATGDAEPLEPGTAAASVGDVAAQVLQSNSRRDLRAIQEALQVVLRDGVSRSCYVTNPYFLPPRAMRAALVSAARRGADVRVLTSGRSDLGDAGWFRALLRASHQHLYGTLLRNGVRVFEYDGATPAQRAAGGLGRSLHAKCLVADGVFAMTGSFNMDRWSHNRNVEVTVGMLDTGVAADMEGHFLDDLRSAREVTLGEWEARPLWLRLCHAAAYYTIVFGSSALLSGHLRPAGWRAAARAEPEAERGSASALGAVAGSHRDAATGDDTPPSLTGLNIRRRVARRYRGARERARRYRVAADGMLKRRGQRFSAAVTDAVDSLLDPGRYGGSSAASEHHGAEDSYASPLAFGRGAERPRPLWHVMAAGHGGQGYAAGGDWQDEDEDEDEDEEDDDDDDEEEEEEEGEEEERYGVSDPALDALDGSTVRGWTTLTSARPPSRTVLLRQAVREALVAPYGDEEEDPMMAQSHLIMED